MKIVKKDYPWLIMAEDKISMNTGKMYQKISLGHNYIKNKDAKKPEDKYGIEWLSFFDEKELLKLSSCAENFYLALKEEREKERQARKQANPKTELNTENLNDEIPW